MNKFEWVPEVDIIRFAGIDLLATSNTNDDNEVPPLPPGIV